MASRVGLIVALVLVSAVVAASTAARQPPTGTAIYVVRADMRLCPSPLCGGYWVAIANGARTRCADGLRYPRCYVARAVDAMSSTLAGIAEGSLVRGAMDLGRDDLGELVAAAVFVPCRTSGGQRAASTASRTPASAACGRRASRWRATQVNGSTRTPVSGVDLEAASATATRGRPRSRGAAHEERPPGARPLRTQRGRRSRLPRAAALPQSAAASRLSTSQASLTSSSVVRKLPIARRST